jgi:phage-related protein
VKKKEKVLSTKSGEVQSPKYALHLQDEIWEFRLKGKDGIARALYVTAQGKRIVVVRVFTKKTQKTPRNEIKVALKRAKEVT